MNTHDARLTVSTKHTYDAVNVTAEIDRALAGAGVEFGICLVSVPHTTCGITVNEDEHGLVEDILRMSAELLSPLAARKPFRHDHIDNNAQAHLTSSLFGSSVAIPIRRGRLRLGTWQNVFLIECDGPRTRQVEITALGI